MSLGKEFFKGFWNENPVLRLLLGLCPALAVTTSAINGIGMGLATTFVLVCSNFIVSLIRGIIPRKVRIPAFIIVIATFVTIVDMVMNGFAHEMHKALGLFIPLIVVNCIILGRAEAFASKNKVLLSLADGFGMGFGFTLSLFVLGGIREILGNGSFLGFGLFGSNYVPVLVFILPPGAFIALGFLLAAMNKISRQGRAA